MNSKVALTSAVMLETQWTTRKNDIIDLITPFVECCIAKVTSPKEQINISKVIELMHSNYGYKNVPEQVIKKVLKRNQRLFSCKKSNYYLLKSLDDVVEKVDKRRKECESHVELVGESLYQYLSTRCQHEKVYSKDDAIKKLHKFFSHSGLDVGVDRLKIEDFSRKNSETFYYIARYIIEKKAEDSQEYKSVISLVKGYFLETALYLQPQNGNLMSAKYKNIVFYYDTPFLLKLLGYSSEQEEQKAKCLHKMLQDEGGKFCFFPQTLQEITNILTAYSYSLSSRTLSHETLEGLNKKRYTYSDVIRLKNTFQTTLDTHFGIKLVEMPMYTENDSAKMTQLINEKELEDFIRSKVTHYKQERLRADMDSAIAIHKLRNGNENMNIENCRHLFVTTNTAFVGAFNMFYSQNINYNTFDLTIDANQLAAITWIKGGIDAVDLPELQLLENAYAAQQPPTELIEKLTEVLNKMEQEGVMSYEEAVAIRTDHYTRKEILLRTNGNPLKVSEMFVEKLRDDYRNYLVAEEHKKAEETITKVISEKEKKEEKEKNIIRHRAENEAIRKAKEAKERYIKHANIIICVFSGIIIIGSIYGFISSTPIQYKFPILLFALVSIISIIDTICTKKIWMSKIIEKLANRKETTVFDKEYESYLNVIGMDKDY